VSEDLAHDAHLRAALRHAPDHALSPPAGLSQTILSAARQAHRAPRSAASPPVRMRPAGSGRLRAWLRHLSSPQWAGMLATGLVAALGLGLWLDLDSEPVVERPDVQAMSKAEVQPAAEAPPAAAAEPTAADAAHVTSGARDASAARRADSRLAREVQPRAQAQAPASAEQPATAKAEQPSDAVAQAAAPAAQSPAAPRPAAQPQAARGATDLREVPDADAARQRSVAEAKANDLRAEPARSALKAKAAAGDAAVVASPALTLLQRARAENAAGSARWTWAAPGSAAMAPFDDAGQAWLQRVVQATRGRWSETSERGESLDAVEARWWRDGWPYATLRIEVNGVRWIEAGGRIRHAPLDTAASQALRTY
jgi:hypothetical protein